MIKSKAGPLVYNSSLCNMIKSKAGPLVYNSSLCNMISPVLLCAVYGTLPISVAQTAINIRFFIFIHCFSCKHSLFTLLHICFL